MKTCELYTNIDEEILCGEPATHEVRFREEPNQWWAACKECLNDRQASDPLIGVLESRPLPASAPAPVPAHKCELEGDADPCGRRAVMEVHFPEDFPGDWMKACVECVDRRLGTFKMELREIKD